MFANSPEKNLGSWRDLSALNSSLGSSRSHKKGKRAKSSRVPGRLSGARKTVELEGILGALEVQNRALSQNAFQGALKTCPCWSSFARGARWHCRRLIKLMQPWETCPRSRGNSQAVIAAQTLCCSHESFSSTSARSRIRPRGRQSRVLALSSGLAPALFVLKSAGKKHPPL